MSPTTKPLKIDLVSDIVCPWCIIGYLRLQQAQRQLLDELQFEVTWRPFELNPQMPPAGENVTEHLSRKYGRPPEMMLEARRHIVQLGHAVGFQFTLNDERRIYNTFDAHRVLHWAREMGRQTEFELALFREYFSAGHNPSAASVLQRVAGGLGLDTDRVDAILSTDAYAAEVRREQRRYQDLGIHSVPAFIVNGSTMITGAQETEQLVNTFRQIARQAA
ncbi:DsbA family oxidoreductase [Exilibacterium tricleocarpae]|uniref:DsbA family oxidoreductase n=1 Tax=Exilibacterium tricleocarpae TaxID=2591008 RepID=A0A545TZQ3_9GAMM|nr:DsbA family oxidoreductase [Exilibacterium tricleocarpae]TQV82687.1 DsbA family oxidoreductase [Exilibacterium tricleocarpae]